MATTEHPVTGLAVVRTRRFLAGAVAVATALVLGAGALAVARGGDDAGPPPTFWSLITGVGLEPHPPSTVDDIAVASDAIVVARVTGVRDGRVEKGVFDPTPPVYGTVPAPRSVFVELTVDQVVAGDVRSGQTLDLELHAPPAPLTLDDVRALMPTDELMFFLLNSGASARKAGYGNLVGAAEDHIWTLASQKGVLAQGSTGLYDALDPNQGDQTFLRSFGTTLDAAVARTQAARH
jgi:hypothetical protein